MLLWKPIDCGTAPKFNKTFTSAAAAVRQGRAIALYYTPERGWYGWQSTGEIEGEPLDRIYPVPTLCGTVAHITEQQLRKIVAAIEIGVPDETVTLNAHADLQSARHDTVGDRATDVGRKTVDTAVKSARGLRHLPGRSNRNGRVSASDLED